MIRVVVKKNYPRAEVKKHVMGWIILLHRAPPDMTNEEGAFIGSFWKHSSAVQAASEYIARHYRR